MRILLWPSSYVPVLGGLQEVCRQLAQHLIAENHQVLVLTQRYPRSLPSHEEIDNVSVRRLLFLKPKLTYLFRGRMDLFLASLYYCPDSRGKADRMIREFQPDIVNVHFPDNQIYFASKLKDKQGFRLIVSLHGDDTERWFKPGSEIKREEGPSKEWVRILKRADAVTACSQYLAQKILALMPSLKNKIHAIHNGVDAGMFKAVDSNSPFSFRYLFAYGRMVHKKGFDLLLEAFSEVSSDFPEIHLVLAGEGEGKSRLEKLVNLKGMGSRIHFAGRLTDKDVARLLKHCEFVVIPSRYEPFGIVGLEAMAAGKAVVFTNTGGLSEFLDPVNNICVRATKEDIAEGIRRMMRLGPGRDEIGSKNKMTVANYSWQRTCQKYIDIYKAK